MSIKGTIRIAEEYELGLDDAEGDEADQWLKNAEAEEEAKKKETEALRNAITAVGSSDGINSYIKERIASVLTKNPITADSVKELCRKLLHAYKLQKAHALIFRENGALRFSDDEETYILGTSVLSEQKDFRKVVSLLTDEQGQPLFPKNASALRLLTTAYLKLKKYEECCSVLLQCDQSFIYQDVHLISNLAAALLITGRKEKFLAVFSEGNRAFIENIKDEYVRAILESAHQSKDFSLLFTICEQLLKIQPGFWNVDSFMGHYSRAYNGLQEYEKTLELLYRDGDRDRKCRFPRHLNCVKNLAYALFYLGRIEEGKAIVKTGIKAGLRPNELQHIGHKVGVTKDGETRSSNAQKRRERRPSGSFRVPLPK